MVDIAPFDPDADPVKEARALVAELKKYDKELHGKPRWLIFNKVDMLDPAEADARIKDALKRLRWTKPWYAISGMNKIGTTELVRAVGEHLAAVKTAEEPEELAVAA